MDINMFHWCWYLLGFIFCPRLTVMIWISIYFGSVIPLPLMVIGWVFAVLGSCTLR